MATKRIKDLSTNKYTGYMALDDSDGTGKFPINNLIGSIAPVFDPATPYKVGQSVMYQGALYTFKVNHPAGAWNASHVDATNTQNYVEHCPAITAFRAGDVIPVDGPNGTAKMSKDNLLMETAENALAGNLAPAFDPTRDAEHPYLVGEVVIEGGELYECTVEHSGVWNPSHFLKTSSDKLLNRIYASQNELSERIALDESGVGAITDGFIRNQDGVVYDSGAGYKCTDFIRLNDKCEINAVYIRSNTAGGVAPIAFYDANKAYLGWIDVASQGYVTGNRTKVPTSAFPAGAVYFRVTINQLRLSSFRVRNPTSLDELSDRLDSIIQSPSVWMPEKVFALDGTTLQIFKGGIALVKNPDNYELHIVNPSSSHCGYNRDWCYEYDVDDTNSDFVLRFGVTNETMKNPVMCSETEIVHVSKKSSPASNKNILCIGDSFTDAGYWVSEFKRLLTGITTSSLSDSSDSDITADALTNLTFIGTRDTDKTPNEGVSGMDYDFFASSGSGAVTNPFWNPNINDVDFDYYCTQNGFSGIDYAVILLGTNYAHSQASVFKVWDKLLAHNPNIKVLILGRCFGSPYGAGVGGIHKNQEFLSLSNGTQLWNSTLQSYCKRDEYKNNFCFLDYNTQMDIFSNFRFSLLPCNIRNTEVTRRGSTNAYDNVHPWIKAYWQIADVVRAGFHYWCLE